MKIESERIMSKEKKYTVTTPAVNYNKNRYTPFGNVQFTKSKATCTKGQAEFLVKKGYACEELGAEGLKKEPSDIEKLKQLQDSHAEAIEAKVQAEAEVEKLKTKIQDLETAKTKVEAKVSELEAKLAKLDEKKSTGNK